MTELASGPSTSASAPVPLGEAQVTDDFKPAKKRKRRRARKKKNAAGAGVAGQSTHDNSSTAGEVSTRTNIPTSGSKSKKKKSGKKKKSSHAKDNAPIIQLPHAKITLRNICNVEKNGSYVKVCNLVRNIINQWNSSNEDSKVANSDATIKTKSVSVTMPLVLDETSMENVQRIDGCIEKSEDTKSTDDGNALIKEQEDDKIEKEMVSTQSKSLRDEKVEDTSGRKEDTPPNNVISIKMMYCNPPRKSRRRGEIPGCAYMVLYPPVPSFVSEKIKLDTTMQMDKIDEKNEMTTITEKTNESSDTTSSCKVEEQSASKLSDGPASVSVTTSTQKSILSTADRSKALAQSRFILQETVSSLAEFCSIDAKKSQNFHGIQIENSRSQKTWKPLDIASINKSSGGKKSFVFGQAFIAKYDSTIEENEDFRNFIETKQREEEERSNRPKPQPGGGFPSSGLSIEFSETGDETKRPIESDYDGRCGPTQIKMENGQQLSAIVLHLREKRQAKKVAQAKAKSNKKNAGISSSSLNGASKESGKKNKTKKASSVPKKGKVTNTSLHADGHDKTKQRQNMSVEKVPKKRQRKRNRSSRGKKASEKATVTPMILTKPPNS